MVVFTLHDRMIMPKMAYSNPRSESNSNKKIAHAQYNSAIPSVHSSACDEEPCWQQNLNLMDERRQKRMISNRESAKRSRMKKQQHLDDLQAQLSKLKSDKSVLRSQFNVVYQNYLTLKAQNRALCAMAMDLSAKLQAVNFVLEQAGGLKMPTGHDIDSGLYSDLTPIVEDIEMEKIWLPQNLKGHEIHH